MCLKIFKVSSVSILCNYSPIFAKFSGNVSSSWLQCVSHFGANSPHNLLMAAPQIKKSPFFVFSTGHWKALIVYWLHFHLLTSVERYKKSSLEHEWEILSHFDLYCSPSLNSHSQILIVVVIVIAVVVVLVVLVIVVTIVVEAFSQDRKSVV